MMVNTNTTVPVSYLRKTLVLILAGGSGSRLQSLTRWHSKPSVPFGGKFRTIDFPLSNCINSGLRQILILTQYKSHSLNSHIQRGWSFLRPELGEFVELLPAQQRVHDSWYLGTADAVYQNLDIIENMDPDYVLILAGDHIYKMDYSLMIEHHVESKADMTVGCMELPSEEATGFGIMAKDDNGWVNGFAEKPKKPAQIPGKPGISLASMGIYVFSKEYLYAMLKRDAEIESSHHDFGKNIIPEAISMGRKVAAFPFLNSDGGPAYWRDVGTVDSYYEANMDLLTVTPHLNLYDQSWPIWTHQEQLPPAKFVFDDDDRRGTALDSLVSGGCIVSGSTVRRSLLSNSVRIHSYSEIDGCVLLPGVEVGRNCRLRQVIVDRNCRIPENTVIGFDEKADRERYFVSPKGVVLVSPEMLESASTSSPLRESLSHAV